MKTKVLIFAMLLIVSVAKCAFAEDHNMFAEKTLIDFKNNNYEALYEKMSEAAKKVMPYDGMVKFFNLEKEILGELERYNKLDSFEQTLGLKPTTTIRYAAYFENTGAVIVLVVIEENGKLACQKLHVDSLIFARPEIQKQFEALNLE